MGISANTRAVALGFGIGAVFLLASFHGVSISLVLETLTASNLVFAVAASVSGLLFMLVKTWRWSVMLKPVLHANFGTLHSVAYMGTAANLVIPHSGELLRATMLGRSSHASSSAVLATIGIERIFDFMVVALLTGVLLLAGRTLPDHASTAGLIALSLVFFGLVVAMFLVAPTRLRRATSTAMSRLLPKPIATFMVTQAKRGVVGLSVLSHPAAAIQAVGLSLLQWCCIIVAIWFSTLSVDHAVTITTAVTVWVLMVVGLALPSAPAQLGTTQLSFALVMVVSGTDPNVAFAASVIYTVFVNIIFMVIGSWCWFRRKRARVQGDPLRQGATL